VTFGWIAERFHPNVAQTHGETRNAYTGFVRECEGKKQLGGPKLRWEANIKMKIT
jgi:hypothetical protein